MSGQRSPPLPSERRTEPDPGSPVQRGPAKLRLQLHQVMQSSSSAHSSLALSPSVSLSSPLCPLTVISVPFCHRLPAWRPMSQLPLESSDGEQVAQWLRHRPDTPGVDGWMDGLMDGWGCLGYRRGHLTERFSNTLEICGSFWSNVEGTTGSVGDFFSSSFWTLRSCCCASLRVTVGLHPWTMDGNVLFYKHRCP